MGLYQAQYIRPKDGQGTRSLGRVSSSAAGVIFEPKFGNITNNGNYLEGIKVGLSINR